MFRVGDKVRVVRICEYFNEQIRERTDGHYSKFKNEIGIIRVVDNNAKFRYIIKFDNPSLDSYLNWHDQELEPLNKNRRIS